MTSDMYMLNLPPFYRLLTLRDGETYKYLVSGGVPGSDRARHGTYIAYLAESPNAHALEREGDALHEYVRSGAEASGDREITVVAVHRDASTRRPLIHLTSYLRGAAGWARAQTRAAAAPGELPLFDGPARRVRDEEDAAEATARWLELVDDGALDRSWELLTTDVKKTSPRDVYVRNLAALRSGRRIAERAPLAVLYTAAPQLRGPVVAIEYLSTLEGGRPAVEAVSLERDGGTWRIQSYFMRGQP